MIQELRALEDKYRRLILSLSDPAFIGNPQKLRDLAKERAELEPVVRKFEEWQKVRRGIEDTRHLLSDPSAEPELRNMAEGEIETLGGREKALEAALRRMLLPKDPYDEKSVILEIRAGAGGDEASLFAQDLLRMYARFAEHKGWKFEVMDTSLSPIGGIKEAVASIRGQGVYSLLKFESGVHRVQRVPRTEASGRIHTSTATVAVLPEAEEIEVDVHPNDLRIDIFRSSGPGGQSVNTTDSAVRITHLPTGLVVSCQDEKSQLQNKEQALRILRARLFEIAQAEQNEEVAEQRRSMVGSGDRSQKIRTYNFQQNRVSDHRIGLTSHRITEVMEGELDEFTEALAAEDRRKQLAAAGGG